MTSFIYSYLQQRTMNDANCWNHKTTKRLPSHGKYVSKLCLESRSLTYLVLFFSLNLKNNFLKFHLVNAEKTDKRFIVSLYNNFHLNGYCDGPPDHPYKKLKKKISGPPCSGLLTSQHCREEVAQWITHKQFRGSRPKK